MVTRERAAVALIPLVWCSCALLVGLEDDHHLAIDPSATDAAMSDSANDAADSADATMSDSAMDSTDGPIDAGDGGPKPIVLAKGHHPTFLRIDTNNAYWVEEATEGANGAIMKVSLAGGAPIVLAANLQKPAGIRISSVTNDVYFTNDWVPPSGGDYGLFSVPISSDGGAPATLVDNDGQGYGALSINLGDFLLSEAWSDNSPTKIRRTTVGQKSCYLASAAGRIPAISSNSSPGYYVDEQAGNIMMTSLACDAGASLFAKTDSTALGFIHVTTYLFWLTSDAIYRGDTTDPGGKPVQIISGISPRQIYASNTGLYFTNGDGTVRYQSTILASGQDDPFGIDVTADGTVLWSNRGSGEIMMLAPQ